MNNERRGEVMGSGVLRPACVSDVPYGRLWGLRPYRQGPRYEREEVVLVENEALRALYDAEWRKRGFERSP